jgi:RimJ/RimL family protein N-acetyltransferase
MNREAVALPADAPAEAIVTARLALRRFTPADLDWLDRLNGDALVTQHMGGPKSRAFSEEMLRDRILPYYEQHPGFGSWVTLEKKTGAAVGFHLLNHIRGETHVQVGYTLAPEFWGLGYATEMAVALLRYGFTQLRLPQIAAITDLPNLSSQRVLLKAGLLRKGERRLAHPFYAKAGPMAWFERDAADWLAERAP